MISVAEARSTIASRLVPRPPIRIALTEALGRVLREEVAADEDTPAFDRSAMDGYAVAADDRSERFRVIGEVQPGQGNPPSIGSGECVRIFTGAPVPPGASQVIMQEDVRREGDWMIPAERSEVLHVRKRGEDVRRGDILLRPGQRLGAGELSMLAHLGRLHPLVSAPVRVLHNATGRELVDPTQTPGPGEIRDTNSTLLAALLKSAGASLVKQLRCGDDLASLIETVKSSGDDEWDLLLISGGASVGDYDFGARALTALAFEIQFAKINLRPGKPLVFAARGAQAAFVLPGNPVSHFVLFHLAIRAALDRLAAASPRWPAVEAVLAEDVSVKGEPREVFVPARLEFGVPLVARPVKWRSSGDLTGLLGAEALLRLPPHSGPFRAGERVECLLLEIR